MVLYTNIIHMPSSNEIDCCYAMRSISFKYYISLNYIYYDVYYIGSQYHKRWYPSEIQITIYYANFIVYKNIPIWYMLYNIDEIFYS